MRPADTVLSLPADVVFPTELSMDLLERAREGTRILSRSVYEGMDVDRYFDVTAVIGVEGRGGPVDAELVEPSGVPVLPLSETSSWPVRMSYFDPSVREGTPDYEVGFRLFDNGVAAGLMMDYGDFVMRGDLVDLTFFNADDC